LIGNDGALKALDACKDHDFNTRIRLLQSIALSAYIGLSVCQAPYRGQNASSAFYFQENVMA
jgi:hypothetical protein